MPARTLHVKKTVGLDARRVAARGDASSYQEFVNLDVTPGQGARTRPGSRPIAKVHSESVGLLNVGGQLRAVAPAGYLDLVEEQHPTVRYLFVGNGNLYGRDSLAKLHAWQSYGSDELGEGVPYLVIERDAGNIEHHYIDDEREDATDAVSTLVTLPFEPGVTLEKLAGRLFADNPLQNTIQYNSIVAGARDWTAAADAGFIPVGDNAPGDRTIKATSHYRSRLVVAFEDSMQLWGVDTAPENISIARSVEDNLNGPGAVGSLAVENVLGDTFYTSSAGVRQLSGTLVQGEREEGQSSGSRVDSVVEALIAERGAPLMQWVPAWSQLLLIFGDVVLALTYIPSDKIWGWSRWEFPYTITDTAIARSELYFRDSDHLVHLISRDYDTDDGEDIVFSGLTQFLGEDGKARVLDFTSLQLGAEGTVSVYARPDVNDPSYEEFVDKLTGSTLGLENIYLGYATQSLALRFTGVGRWQMDSFAISFKRLVV